MAIQSFQLDPNAASYTDDQIVGKVNAATANITRSGSIEGTAVDGLDSDDIGEGVANFYGAEANATADQSGDEIVAAIDAGASSITREDALSQTDLKLVKTNPAGGEYNVLNIQRDSAGLLDVEYDDVAE